MGAVPVESLPRLRHECNRDGATGQRQSKQVVAQMHLLVNIDVVFPALANQCFTIRAEQLACLAIAQVRKFVLEREFTLLVFVYGHCQIRSF